MGVSGSSTQMHSSTVGGNTKPAGNKFRYGAREEMVMEAGKPVTVNVAGSMETTLRLYPEGMRIGCTFIEAEVLKRIIAMYVSSRLNGESA